jgi:hypothetical protein
MVASTYVSIVNHAHAMMRLRREREGELTNIDLYIEVGINRGLFSLVE